MYLQRFPTLRKKENITRTKYNNYCASARESRRIFTHTHFKKIITTSANQCSIPIYMHHTIILLLFIIMHATVVDFRFHFLEESVIPVRGAVLLLWLRDGFRVEGLSGERAAVFSVVGAKMFAGNFSYFIIRPMVIG